MNEKEIWLCFAITSTVLFIGKQLLSFMGSDADDSVLDGINHDFDSGEVFTFISFQGILAFIMGTSWMGLSLRYEYQWNLVPTILGAVGLGLIMMVLSSFLLFQAHRLNHKPKLVVTPQVGALGKAYIKIPQTGRGKVQIPVGNKLVIVDALTDYVEIPAGKSIKVIKVHSNHLVHVQEV